MPSSSDCANPGPVPCTEETCTCDCEPCDSSGSPIRYFNGEISLSETDLYSPVPGFGHVRSYSNRLTGGYEGPNGNNWLMINLPYIAEVETGAVYEFVRGQERVWFDKSGGTYTARNADGAKYDLAAGGSDELVLTKRTSAGVESFVFFDFTVSLNKGMFNAHQDAYGNLTETVWDSMTEGLIQELRYTVDSEDEAYAIFYDYNGSNRISTATLKKTDDINAGTVVWDNIRRAVYEYYTGSGDYDFGSAHDLKLVTVEDPDSSGNFPISNPIEISKSYYRYYETTDPNGFLGALKYVVSPIAYAEMLEAGDDPLTDDVAPYADHYFEYDSLQQVTEEIARNCSGCGGGGGTGSAGETFMRSRTTNGSYVDDYNNWEWKVVVTKANGNIETVYTNHLGQVLLKELKWPQTSPTPDKVWRWVKQYGTVAEEDAGKVVKTASPAAVTSCDETENDLGITLKTDAGLVTYNTYYSTTGSGAFKGYLEKVEIREGDGASGRILQRSLKYTTNNDAVQISEEKVYTATNGTGAITTSYSYTWYPSSNKVQQIETTLPDTSGQNGTTAITRHYFDANGRLTYTQDARGIITKNYYNEVTGLMTQSVVDASTIDVGGPSWSVNAGSHLDLTSDYSYDNLGRQIEMLGPAHDADLGGANADEIRHATWTVYAESVESDQVWTGQGYQKDPSGTSTMHLVNPVQIAITDKNGRPTYQITAKRTTGSGALSASDEFLYSSWSRWSASAYDATGRMIHQRVYHDLPSQTGTPSFPATDPKDLNAGSEGAAGNYVETNYTYDDTNNRRIKTLSPDQTITRTVYDGINRPIETWVGTDDTGATPDDPGNGGAGGNNMVKVSSQVYDGGDDQKDSFLTQQTAYVNGTAANNRVTTYTNDFRGRRLAVDGEVDLFIKNTYDNLDRMTQVDRYDTTEAAANLVGRQKTYFDDRSRVYQTEVYEVDPTSGTVGTHLTGENWHDADGNQTQSIAPGAGAVWTKSEFDNIGRQTRSYTGYTDGSTDVIVQDNVTVYNDASQVTRTETKQLDTGSTAASQDYRTSYLAMIYDGIGRTLAQINYGVDAPTAWPDTVPARSDIVLVSSTEYDPDTGEATTTTDPGGIVTEREYDDMGRLTKQIDNKTTGSAEDQNRETQYTYTADSQIKTMTAVMAANEVTTYNYGVSASTGSQIAANNLLYQVVYPTDNPVSGGVIHAYNRQGQVLARIDQNSTRHDYTFDKLGRPTTDAVVNVGTGIDSAVERLTTTYNNRGLPELLTSWSSHTGGSKVNEVKLEYNDFGQLTSDWQEHDGAVQTASGPGQSLRVQYAYADGGTSGSPTNQIRPTSITYPDNRQLDFGYAGEDDQNDNLNRVSQIKEGSTVLASYKHLGLGMKTVANYEAATLRWDIWGGVVGAYDGLDAFNRLEKIKWIQGTNSLRGEYSYGYNRNSMPTYRKDSSLFFGAPDWGELYGRDELERLDDFTRGKLDFTGTPTIPTADAEFRQQFDLDEVANWGNLKQDDSGDGSSGWPFEQARSHNTVNEITNFTDVSGPAWVEPSYDAAGNTVGIPSVGNVQTEKFLVYDAWNRLVRYETDESFLETEYAYDARGFRIKKDLYSNEGLDYDATRHFYYTNQWQCVEERIQDPPTAAAAVDRQYVWGLRYIDDLIQRKRDTTNNGTLDETLYAVNDRQFNIVALASTAGAIQQRMSLTPYGQVTWLTSIFNASSNTYDWRHVFQGLRTDEESGLIENRKRVIHPLLGRFLQRDALGYVNGMSLYAAYQVIQAGVDPYGLESGSVLTYFNTLVNDPKDGPNARALKASIEKLKKMKNVNYDEERVGGKKSNKKDREEVAEALTSEETYTRWEFIRWKQTGRKSAFQDDQWEAVMKKKKYRAPKEDPCLIVAFIGHYLGADFFKDNNLFQPMYATIPDGQSASDPGYTDRPSCNVSFGATSCLAGRTEDDASQVNYNTIPSGIGVDTYLAGSEDIAANHPLRGIMTIDPSPLMVHAKSMVDSVQQRAKELLDPNAPCPCDEVDVIIVWGSHSW